MREMTNIKHILSLVRNIKSPPWPILHTSHRCNCCPSLDLEYYTNLLEYQNLLTPGYFRYCMAEAVINSLLQHNWILTEEIVIFCLLDENFPVRVQRGVADKVMAAELPKMKIGKPNLKKQPQPSGLIWSSLSPPFLATSHRNLLASTACPPFGKTTQNKSEFGIG